MAKKDKKSKKLFNKLHDRHHQTIHNYIMRKRIEDGEVEGLVALPEHHVIPTHQESMHIADHLCQCLPIKVADNPMTGSTVWMHKGWVH